jgi:hypothetical protein
MGTQVERFADAGLAELGDAALQKEVLAERSLLRHVLRGIAVAVPVSVVIWVGLIALAVGNKHPDWAVWLAMATGIGSPVRGFGPGDLVIAGALVGKTDHRCRPCSRSHDAPPLAGATTRRPTLPGLEAGLKPSLPNRPDVT